MFFYRFSASSIYVTDIIRQPGNLANTYRSLQLLTNGFNSIMSDYFLIFLNNLQKSLSVICNVVIIQLHDKLSIATTLTLMSFSWTANVYLIINYVKLGGINEMSKNMTASWKRNSMKSKIVFAYIRSFKLLKIELGSFGFYRKPASIKILGSLIYYTTKALMVTKSYF